MRWRLMLACLGLVLGACSTVHVPRAVDGKSGLYATDVEVDPGAVLKFDASFDPMSYKYVVIMAETPIRPSVLSFLGRYVLAQAGIKNVYSLSELADLARDRGLGRSGERMPDGWMFRLARESGPILIVSLDQSHVGGVRWLMRLNVVDVRSGKRLLQVDHLKQLWANLDEEMLYPVLNELLKWIKKSARGKA